MTENRASRFLQWQSPLARHEWCVGSDELQISSFSALSASTCCCLLPWSVETAGWLRVASAASFRSPSQIRELLIGLVDMKNTIAKRGETP